MSIVSKVSIVSTVWKCLGRCLDIQAGEGEGAVSAVRAGAWGRGGTAGKPGHGQPQSGASNTSGWG